MATNAYCTVAEVKAWLQITDSTEDTVLDVIVGAVSRWVDGYCGQRFWLDGTATARTYEAISRYVLAVDGIGDSTTVIITTDAAGDGTYETTWLASDYELLPTNAATHWPEPTPYTMVRAVGAQTFPLSYGGLLARRDRVKVTAKYGYLTVPDRVKQATIMQSARTFKRRYSPEGVAGFGDMGAVRVTSVDHDVHALLQSHRLGGEVAVFA